MECPTCGYVFQPFETDCPRCLRQQQAKASPPVLPNVAQPLPAAVSLSPSRPAPSLPGNGSPDNPKTFWLVTVLSTVNARLLLLVALLSVACIYLSGVVIGRKIEANTEALNPFSNRPVAEQEIATPGHSSTSRAQDGSTLPYFPPVRNSQEVEALLAAIGRLETQKRLILTQSQPTNGSRLGWSEQEASADQQAANGNAMLTQTHQQWERLRQLQQALATLPRPTVCVPFYNAYQRYLMTLDINYKGLERALEQQAQNIPGAQDMLATVYRNAPGNIRQAAAEAERELHLLCTRYGLSKPFTIE